MEQWRSAKQIDAAQKEMIKEQTARIKDLETENKALKEALQDIIKYHSDTVNRQGITLDKTIAFQTAIRLLKSAGESL